MNMRKAIEVSETLYKCREQSITLKGQDGFVKMVAEWKAVFDEVQTQNSCGVLQALTILLERAKGHSDEGMLMHLLSAVACELAEPTVTIAA